MRTIAIFTLCVFTAAVLPEINQPHAKTMANIEAGERCRFTGVAPFAFDTIPRLTNKKPGKMNKKSSEIKGIYSAVPNPCLTKPCLPGLSAAITTPEEVYFLLKNGNLCNDGYSWPGFTPNHGDTVAVKGRVQPMRDIDGNPFQAIEVEEIYKPTLN